MDEFKAKRDDFILNEQPEVVDEKLVNEELDKIIVSIPSVVESDISKPDERNHVKDLNQAFHQKIRKQINDRDLQYTNLLKHYLTVSKVRNWGKEIFKGLFLCSLIFSLVYVSICEAKILNMLYLSNDINQMISAIPIFITAITGFVSAVIAIPLVITKYLFNSDEDNSIAKIILHTQKHDMSGRKLLEHMPINNNYE